MGDNVKMDKPWNVAPAEPVEGMAAEGTEFETPTYEKEYAAVGTTMERRDPTVCYLITGDALGSDEKLGVELMQQFIQSMAAQKLIPNYILFVNRGVLLTNENSLVTGDLLDFVEEDAVLLTSAESLDFYGLRSKVAVGRVAAADEMAMILHTADKVVTF